MNGLARNYQRGAENLQGQIDKLKERILTAEAAIALKEEHVRAHRDHIIELSKTISTTESKRQDMLATVSALTERPRMYDECAAYLWLKTQGNPDINALSAEEATRILGDFSAGDDGIRAFYRECMSNNVIYLPEFNKYKFSKSEHAKTVLKWAYDFLDVTPIKGWVSLKYHSECPESWSDELFRYVTNELRKVSIFGLSRNDATDKGYSQDFTPYHLESFIKYLMAKDVDEEAKLFRKHHGVNV